MNTNIIRVLIAEPMAEEGLNLLRKDSRFKVDICLNLSSHELLKKVNDYNCLLVRSQTKVDESLLHAGKKLKLIGRAGVGVDNIDLVTAKKLGIAVINTPSGNSISAAELAFGLMIGLARKLPFAHVHVQQGLWNRANFKGIELYNKTLCIIGFGNVGQNLAQRALGFEMKVVIYDPWINAEAIPAKIKKADLVEALKEADFVSLHCPLNEETRDIINKKTISFMKPGMRLINTARGELINDAALLQGLEDGIIGSAALDVYRCEPPAKDDPLIQHPRIMLSPHLGASTEEAQRRVCNLLAEQTMAFFKGESPIRVV